MIDSQAVARRADEIYQSERLQNDQATDKRFLWLMLMQWLAMMAAALWISPRAWTGTQSAIHAHVWQALFLGGAITLPPVALAIFMPGRVVTRHVIAVCQMLASALLIHVSGGRVETHFHIFGSLAFLAFYRDWRVLVSASVVIAADHWFRGVYFPQSVYGVLMASPWRWFEHAGWVVFEDIFLIEACVRSVRGSRGLAQRTALLEATKERMERAKDAAEAASRAKTEFLDNMSHEIRTPMNGMMGMVSLVLETSLGAQQRQQLETARESAESLMIVLNDVLDFSKLEAGKLTLEPVKFSLAHCISSATRTALPAAAQKQLSLTHEIPPGTVDRLVGDPVRLRQILLNLVINAIKFTEQGGVNIGVAAEGRQDQDVILHFTVRDSGIGIDAAKQRVIFDAFQQGDGSATRQYGGNGLGLTVCSRLVALMNGCLWVESELGRGSTFHFTASFAVAKEQGPAPVKREDPLLILLAEDNLVNQTLALRTLERRGHRVTVARNGQEAVDLARDRHFDIVLMDVQMPLMDGLEATRLIRQSDPLIPIIAMTAHSLDTDRERCLAAGMNGHTTKPIQPEKLFAAIQAQVAASRVNLRVNPRANMDA
jgi:two-component system sensor histidine kinase/response regulator